MKKEEFCEVLGDINENYVKEAGTARKAEKPHRIKWRAMAACLCFVLVIAIAPSLWKPQENDGVGDNEGSTVQNIVTAPGFFTFTAYAASLDDDMTTGPSEDEEVIMQEGIEIPVNYHWNPAMSSRPGIPFTLSAPAYPDTIFEISVKGGELLLWKENKITHVKSPFYAENGTTIYWTSLSQTDEGNMKLYMKNEAYINIVIREGENIVGYAVVEIYSDAFNSEVEQAYTYYAKLLKSVSFPQVNGSYQRITAEHVETEMQQIRNKNTDMKQNG